MNPRTSADFEDITTFECRRAQSQHPRTDQARALQRVARDHAMGIGRIAHVSRESGETHVCKMDCCHNEL
jgi:hypothetical protein